MFRVPPGRSEHRRNYLRARTSQSQSLPWLIAIVLVTLLLPTAVVVPVAAGRSRDHGQQQRNGNSMDGSSLVGGGGGGFRSRPDRLRHHAPEKFGLTIAKEQEQHSEFMKGKICIGTNGRMSVPSNRDHHFRNLRDRYTNCTYVDGNLELTWLQDSQLDLSFLQHIREVTGYVLISHVDVNIVLPRLQIIRGRTLFKLNILEEQFGLFVTYSQMHTLELPALRDILAGSVGLFNNYNLCHVRSINWDEIITGPKESLKYTYNFTSLERVCPPCHASCEAGCWGEGAHNCQKFSKTNCSPQCSQGRCFGPKPRDCCHLFCAGGCTGPTQKDCLACRNFYDDGVCKQECPPMQKYNPTNYLWEPNPDGKYAYGATCVRNCPEHLLKDSGACVRTCPLNKTAINGECVQCNGPCPKTCPGTGTVHSGNIDSFKDCTIIEGSLEILDQSFDGFQQVFTNFSFGPRFIKMHPDRLEVFSTLREVTGFINIQGFHPAFTNLSYFRNLEVIGGRQLMDTYFASLYIVKTALTSLELSSLKRINSGAVVILENKELCFVEDVKWEKIKKTTDHPSMIQNNRNRTECRTKGLICSEECSEDGCWGSGAEQCLECKNFLYNGTCLQSCMSLPNIYQVNEKECGICHPECKHSCNGPGAEHCTSCRSVKDNKFCVRSCPESKFNQSGICVFCHESCDGCMGPKNILGPQGCVKCEKAIIGDGTTPVRCLKKEEPCPDGHYYDVIFPQDPTILGLSGLAGEATCRKCHPRCKVCTSYGFHEQACQKCSIYKRGEQCEDECPNDHYVDTELSECFPCHSECRGCTGPGADHCLQCRSLKIFTGESALAEESFGNLSATFNCTASCTPDYPFKIYPTSELGLQPYCSAVQTHAGFLEQTAEAPVILLGALVGLLVVVVICVVIMLYCNKKTKESKEAAKMTKIMCEDAEPLRPSNVGPNLTRLTIIKEQQLRRSKLLGQGAFGAVYQGMWIMNDNNKLPVAIKIPLEMSGPQAMQDFLDEAYIMVTVDHPNLLNLLAVCMTTEMMFVTQLMPQGSLLDYVKKKQKDTGSKALLNWSTQIARGMAYLEERRLVHRDLAARNVLVKNASQVKISDFGLAKLLSQDCDEYKAAGGKMPIKWLALECIRNRVFTSKSDVWAFGVTIWELLTFGERPYGDIPAKDVPGLIECGERLVQPNICSLDVYMTLLGCWNLDAGLRPSFKDLVEVFSTYAQDPGRYLCIPNDNLMCLPSITSHDEKDLIRNLPAMTDNPLSVDALGATNGGQPKHQSRHHGHHAHHLGGHHHHMQHGHTQHGHHGGDLGGAAGSSMGGIDQIPSSIRYCPDPMKGGGAMGGMAMGDDVCDHKVCIGSLKLDLPLDEDDYLMPSGPVGGGAMGGGNGGYMDLIGSPSCVENPEYLIGAGPAPTQTIGIPVMMMMPPSPTISASMAASAAAASMASISTASLPAVHGHSNGSGSSHGSGGSGSGSGSSHGVGNLSGASNSGSIGHMSSSTSMTVLPSSPTAFTVVVDGQAQVAGPSHSQPHPMVGGGGGGHGDVHVPSDHEYYNDLQREMQPLQRSETTV